MIAHRPLEWFFDPWENCAQATRVVLRPMGGLCTDHYSGPSTHERIADKPLEWSFDPREDCAQATRVVLRPWEDCAQATTVVLRPMGGLRTGHLSGPSTHGRIAHRPLEWHFDPWEDCAQATRVALRPMGGLHTGH